MTDIEYLEIEGEIGGRGSYAVEEKWYLDVVFEPLNEISILRNAEGDG